MFFAKARKHASSLDKALHSEAIDNRVYENLIESVSQSTPVLHRYIALRKKVLPVEEYHIYDMYVPIVKEIEQKHDYDEAYDMVVEALSVLGDEYADTLKSARNSGWIDVEETENKRSGAYSWGVRRSSLCTLKP